MQLAQGLGCKNLGRNGPGNRDLKKKATGVPWTLIIMMVMLAERILKA